MQNLIYKLISYLPSQKGKEALLNLQKRLALGGGVKFNFRHVVDESGDYIIAESENLEDKCIIVTGKTLAEVDKNIKDALFTAFHVPAYYVDYNCIKSPIKEKIELCYATR